MEEKKEPAFSPDMSKRAKKIATFTKKDVFDRYIVKESEDVTADLNTAMTIKNPDNTYVYKTMISLSNCDSFNYLGSVLELQVKPLIPKGYKLNAPNVIFDLEQILSENLSKVQEAFNNSDKITPFFIDFTKFFAKRISTAYTLKDDETFTIGNN